MPVLISAKTSTDSGNLAKFGNDGGLYVGPVTNGTTGFYVIDNAFAATGQTGVYSLSSGATTTAAIPNAWVWPLMFTKPCRIVGMAGCMYSSGAGYGIYNATYASSSSSGLPTTKIADVSNYVLATAVSAALTPFNFTMTNTSAVYLANTLYWMASWSTGGNSVIAVRSSATAFGAIRSVTLPAVPAAYTSGNQAISYVESSSSSPFYPQTATSGPSTLNLFGQQSAAPGTNQQYAPLYYFQLTNA